jgi:hypothetical protein
MDHPEGAGSQRGDRVDFDPRVRLEFRGTQLSSDGGLLVMRELDDALGLSDLASTALSDTRRGKNTVHRLDGLFRQSVFGRLAGYEDVNDADRLALDPVMRQIVGGRAVDAQAASASQMGRFETETLALAENRAALADLNGQWIYRFHDRNGMKYIVLDLDSSVSPTHGDQEGTAWNGHFDCTCYHPLFVFNQFGMLERCALRHGNVHSADGWQDVLLEIYEGKMPRICKCELRVPFVFLALPLLFSCLLLGSPASAAELSKSECDNFTKFLLASNLSLQTEKNIVGISLSLIKSAAKYPEGAEKFIKAKHLRIFAETLSEAAEYDKKTLEALKPVLKMYNDACVN